MAEDPLGAREPCLQARVFLGCVTLGKLLTISLTWDFANRS